MPVRTYSGSFYWRPIAKKQPLTKKQVAARRACVDKYVWHGTESRAKHVGLVFDWVTLTKATELRSARQKHAAQSFAHMWMRSGEKTDSSPHTHNRFGIQLGKKVLFWSGFKGAGEFTLRLWTPRPKMKKAAWAKLVPDFGQAAMPPHVA